MNAKYTNNHYVPEWYQKRFISLNSRDHKLYYLDKVPPVTRDSRGNLHQWNPVGRKGPRGCFCQNDLYTTFFGGQRSTEIEENFFGEIDRLGREAVEHFASFDHTQKGTHKAYRNLIVYLCTQKLRTPKGLKWLQNHVGTNETFFLMMQLRESKALFSAIWSESVWQIADASCSSTKFIISDHPVTTYNRDCRPLDPKYRGFNDPDIRMNGTHTIFPLSSDKVLLLTNLSWARNPHQSATKFRPNPRLERDSIFFIPHIQVKRQLSEQEVREINYIIKRRSFRFIAAEEKEWLYPDKYVSVGDWNKYGKGYLCIPDPRSMSLTGEILIGYKGGGADAFDSYGRKPWQEGYSQDSSSDETDAFYSFMGEFARLFGPKRRGRSFEMGRLEPEEDSPDYHKYHLSCERRQRH